MELIATSTFGLEAVVGRELQGLGYECQTLQNGRVLFSGEAAAIARANLWLRTSDRVLLRIGAFTATDFGVLFDSTYALPWEEWIPADAAFPVKGRSVQSQLSSVPACQKIVKKAIVEKLKQAHGVTTLPESGALYTIEVGLLKDLATLTIDTSGVGLHKRGYRTLSGQAPLKETLAAALVLLSYWRPDRPLIDPFCGSGTIPIEAAMIGRNLAPGQQRAFVAETWPNLPAEIWSEARTEASDLAGAEIPGMIMGTDQDAAALSLARHHAANAGVANDIHFQQRTFADLTSQRRYGCLICNPPYGERVGERPELRELYASMPAVLRHLPTWSHYILTAYRGFESILGQRADRRRKLYNGRIECTYFQFHGPSPQSRAAAGDATGARDTAAEPVRRPPIAAAFGGTSPKMQEQAEAFRRRLAKRARHLRKWPTQLGISCYRIYERDIPEVPLIVDRYADRLHISEYERPHDHTPAEHADWLDLMARTAGEVLEVARDHIFAKHRARQRGLLQHERQGSQGHVCEVSEGGLRFLVNLSDYIDTGLFLDHRITRSLVRDEAGGKRFLNLFGYTGTFSVYAAAGGARSTTTVDLSSTYLDWARENMQLNGFTGGEHEYIRDDVAGFLARTARGRKYDLAVVDPPTFSNSKRMEGIWDVQRDHVRLLGRVLELVTPGAAIFFSTSFRRFKLDPAATAGATVREISGQTVPDDFRNRRIHRCWRIDAGDASSTAAR